MEHMEPLEAMGAEPALEIEGMMTKEFPDGVLETRDAGDGYEMVLELGARRETLRLPGANEAEARALHEFAASLIDRNPGAKAAADSYVRYVLGAVEARRHKLSH